MTEYFYTATYKRRNVSPGTPKGFTSGVYQSEKATAQEAFEDLRVVLLEYVGSLKNYGLEIQKFERI
jgi:hypothetical protein